MKLYRAFATVGGLTMLSRVLGFARDILIAAGLGTGLVADAYFVAFRFPNLFRRVFGEGAFNSAFVPLFTKRLEGEGAAAARGFAEEALAALLVALLVVSALAEIAMPWLMYALAPGFSNDPAKFDLAVLLTRIAFPYLACMSVVALLSGVLNSMGRFSVAAAAPVLLNVVLIGAITLVLWLGFDRQPGAGLILAIAVTLGGLTQLAILWWAAAHAGFGPRLRRPRLTAGVRRLVTLGVPGLVAGGITQINLMIGTIIASLQAGAVSYLYYADRLYQLPLGIVGIAVGVVLLPELSRQLRTGDARAALDSQNRGLEFAMLLTLPAAVALAVAAEPVIGVLFERGAFTAQDTRATAAALAAFAFGLPSFVLIRVFQPAFFAREDTKTPMRLAVLNMALNVAGSLALFHGFAALGFMPHVGIPVATGVASWTNALMLWRRLATRGGFAPDARLKRNLPLILLASAVMGVALAAAMSWLGPTLASGQPIHVRAMALAALLTLGALVFATLIAVTGVLRPAQLRQLARRSG